MPSTVSDRARELSLQYYEDALPAHDIYHAKRVRDVAVRLANQQPDHGDWAATEAAALFEAEDVSDDQRTVIENCL